MAPVEFQDRCLKPLGHLSGAQLVERRRKESGSRFLSEDGNSIRHATLGAYRSETVDGTQAGHSLPPLGVSSWNYWATGTIGVPKGIRTPVTAVKGRFRSSNGPAEIKSFAALIPLDFPCTAR